MFYFSHGGAYVDEEACDKAWEDYFLKHPSRPKQSASPNLQAFLLELAGELKACPSSHVVSEREERARDRAEACNEAVSTDQEIAKQPRAAAIQWFATAEADANEQEVLFYAFLLIWTAKHASDLDFWARRVLHERVEAETLKNKWRPRTAAQGGFSETNRVSDLFDPMRLAYCDTAWSDAELDWIGKAMQLWDGPGQRDDLRATSFRNHMRKDEKLMPRGVGRDNKTKGPPRWRTWSIVLVADLIHTRGPELRRQLKLDLAPEKVLAAHERVALAEKHSKELEDELKRVRKERDKAQNAYRKASIRNENKTQEKRSAVQTVKDSLTTKLADKLAAAMTRMKRKAETEVASARKKFKKVQRTALTQAAKVIKQAEAARSNAEVMIEKKSAQLEQQYADKLEELRTSKNKAHAEKRDAKAETLKVKRKLRRTELQLERALQSSDESSSEDGSEDGYEDSSEDEQTPVKTLTFQPFDLLPRRDAKGRFQAEAPDVHALRIAQLGRGAAPSLVAKNITDVLALVAPDVEIPEPCVETLRRMRGEVTLVGEAMAAWKFAKAKRILFAGWDESTKFGDAVFAMTFLVEHFDGRREEVCLRGLTLLPAGGTSKAILEHIETRIFTHSRHILGLWIQAYEKESGAGSWAAATGPPVENIGLHRLCEDTVLMSDTCNAARCTKRLLGEAIMRTMQEKVGAEAWEKMSVDERNAKYRYYRADCWQHLRNILIAAMSDAANTFLKDQLSESLEQFSSYERIEVEGEKMIRAAFNQFHHGGEYAKGRGREFEAWRKRMHKSSMWIPFCRAMGSRQDLAFDGCVPLFLNRLVCLEFLQGYIDCPKSQNVLDKSLYTLLRCNEFVALLRANTLWQLLFSAPFRWLAGKTGKIPDWSLWNMSGVLDLVEGAMEVIKADPQKLLDPGFDMFDSVAEQVPEFKKWREDYLAETVRAEDNTTEYEIHREILRRARSPAAGSGDEQSTEMTLKLIQQMATRALEKLHDKKIALADKLTSQGGVNALGKRQEAAERTHGIDGTNDRSENKFAIADYVMRTYRGISVFNASGIVQQRSAHDFDRPSRVVSDRRKRKQTAEPPPEFTGGFFWTLSRALRHSLLTMARHELQPAINRARAEQLSHDNEKLSKREQAVQSTLNSLVTKYAEALELFDAWQSQRWKSAEDVTAGLAGKSISEQLRLLRLQIEMRTVGCGWRQFETKWGFFADEKQHTVDHLKALLKDVMVYERTLIRNNHLPSEAAPPQLTKRLLKTLGTEDVDAARLEAQSTFNTALLLPKAQAERARREAAGISDSVEVRQPEKPPAFDVNLVGKQLEICWPYKLANKTAKIWASGRVVRVADGVTHYRSAGCKKPLDAGAVLWAWEADPDYDEPAGEEWLFLKPDRWNKHVQFGWRYDPCELAAQAAARMPPRAPQLDPVDPYVTDDEYDPCDDFQ